MVTGTDKRGLDLSYSIEDFDAGTRRDSHILYRVIEDTMLDLVTPKPGARVLDVACGTGKQAMRIAQRDCYAVGAEASMEMIGLGRWVQPESQARIVRSIAEVLPFRDGAFDRVMCQGSLDHFADAASFMREAARIISPDGRVVIALANFESVACRIGRLVDLVKRKLRRPRPPWRPYWRIPEDHNVKGDLPYVKSLGGDDLVLERCFGVSMLWNVAPYAWTLDHLPQGIAEFVWRALDRIVRRRPQHSDMIFSIWRKRDSAVWPANS
jgi:SAM-dependent methyltransferase